MSGFSGVYGGGGGCSRQDELRLRSGGVLHTSICQPLFARRGWIYDRFAGLLLNGQKQIFLKKKTLL